jgi:predicted dehydrogenase
VIFNKQKEIGSTGVDLDSYVELKFENNFTSKIGVSFTRNLGKQTKIIGTKGELVIHDTWTSENSEIVIKKNNKTEIINIIGNQNIYSHEIETISQCIIEEKKEVDYPSLTIDQTIGNMKIIDKWLS